MSAQVLRTRWMQAIVDTKDYVVSMGRLCGVRGEKVAVCWQKNTMET